MNIAILHKPFKTYSTNQITSYLRYANNLPITYLLTISWTEAAEWEKKRRKGKLESPFADTFLKYTRGSNLSANWYLKIEKQYRMPDWWEKCYSSWNQHLFYHFLCVTKHQLIKAVMIIIVQTSLERLLTVGHWTVCSSFHDSTAIINVLLDPKVFYIFLIVVKTVVKWNVFECAEAVSCASFVFIWKNICLQARQSWFSFFTAQLNVVCEKLLYLSMWSYILCISH